MMILAAWDEAGVNSRCFLDGETGGTADDEFAAEQDEFVR